MIRRSAVGETFAHLLSLEAAGRVRRADSEVDAWELTEQARREWRRGIASVR